MADDKRQSKIHRFMVGDKVQYVVDGHDELEMQSEGEVKGFANDEGTYLHVIWGDGQELVVTEDELRRLSV